MKRRAVDETVKPFRFRTDGDALTVVRDAITGWLDEGNRHHLASTIPTNLGVVDRAADVWEPLVSVADLAGGSWPTRAQEAAHILCSEQNDDDDDSDAMQLISDIEIVLTEYMSDLITPAALLQRLQYIEGYTNSPWQAMTPRSLSNRLKEHQIVTKPRRTDAKSSERTYMRSQLDDLVKRHRAPHPAP